MTSAYGDRLQVEDGSAKSADSSEAYGLLASDEERPVVEEPQPGLYYRLHPDARGGIVLTEVLRRRGPDGRRVVLTRYVSGSRRNGRSCTCGLWRRAGTCFHLVSVEWALAEAARAKPLLSTCSEEDRHLFVCGACGGDASTGWRRGRSLLCTACLEERRLRERPAVERQRETGFCARCGMLAAGLVAVVGDRYCPACAGEVLARLPGLVARLYRKIEACERFSQRCLRLTGRRSEEADLYASDLRRTVAWLRPQAVEQFRQQLLARLKARKVIPPVAAPVLPAGEATSVAFEGVPAA
ncbi:MAG: hypothetical protein RDU83_00130 [bacterium]|nr:hypothetical protein [bacterium]